MLVIALSNEAPGAAAPSVRSRLNPQASAANSRAGQERKTDVFMTLQRTEPVKPPGYYAPPSGTPRKARPPMQSCGPGSYRHAKTSPLAEHWNGPTWTVRPHSRAGRQPCLGLVRGESPAKWWELKLIPGDDQSAETSSGTDASSSSRSPASFAIEPSEK